MQSVTSGKSTAQGMWKSVVVVGPLGKAITPAKWEVSVGHPSSA